MVRMTEELPAKQKANKISAFIERYKRVTITLMFVIAIARLYFIGVLSTPHDEA